MYIMSVNLVSESGLTLIKWVNAMYFFLFKVC
uniref:Uncharacterized protein n=1 Tax=Anguilla anguilla TaxID=7936 RepID=A0A0E9SFR1_ANGAN